MFLRKKKNVETVSNNTSPKYKVTYKNAHSGELEVSFMDDMNPMAYYMRENDNIFEMYYLCSMERIFSEEHNEN